MKTLIVGTGVIGAIYGWALSHASVDVTHFVRMGKKEQLKDGVTLDLLDERKRHLKYNITKYALECVEEISPTDDYDLIIVPTNVHQTEDALKTLVPVSGNAIFLRQVLSTSQFGSFRSWCAGISKEMKAHNATQRMSVVRKVCKR